MFKYQSLLKVSSNRLIVGKDVVGFHLFYMELLRNRDLLTELLREAGLIKCNFIWEKYAKRNSRDVPLFTPSLGNILLQRFLGNNPEQKDS